MVSKHCPQTKQSGSLENGWKRKYEMSLEHLAVPESKEVLKKPQDAECQKDKEANRELPMGRAGTEMSG